MQLHMVLTPEVNFKRPDTTKIIQDFGQITVIFNQDRKDIQTGLHCFIEDSKENLVAWLGQFDGVIVGNGNPMMESFQIMEIKKDE